jgi:hypothetical protein
MEKLREKRQVSIMGVVVPTDWDARGTISAVSISTPREEEYLVENGSLAEDLLELYGAEVLVMGTVSEDDEGNRLISVESYELLGDYDEDEEGDQEENWLDEGDYEDLGDFEEDQNQWDE